MNRSRIINSLIVIFLLLYPLPFFYFIGSMAPRDYGLRNFLYKFELPTILSFASLSMLYPIPIILYYQRGSILSGKKVEPDFNLYRIFFLMGIYFLASLFIKAVGSGTIALVADTVYDGILIYSLSFFYVLCSAPVFGYPLCILGEILWFFLVVVFPTPSYYLVKVLIEKVIWNLLNYWETGKIPFRKGELGFRDVPNPEQFPDPLEYMRNGGKRKDLPALKEGEFYENGEPQGEEKQGAAEAGGGGGVGNSELIRHTY